MAKRRQLLGFRVNPEERLAILEGYEMSGMMDSLSTYIRKLAMGEIQHPDHEDGFLTALQRGDVRNVGPITGSYETRVHYSAFVLAAEMLRLKTDPTYVELLSKHKQMYINLVNEIRGYEYNDETKLKSPLPYNLPTSDRD